MKKRKMVDMWVFTYIDSEYGHNHVIGYRTKKIALKEKKWMRENVCNYAGAIVKVRVPAPEGK